MVTAPAVAIRGDALALPLPADSVDLVVTSPPYFGLRSYQDACPDCADRSKANMRGYMERYCPECKRVFESGRNKCHKCDRTTLATAKTKADRDADCPTCGGTGRGHYAGQLGSEATPAEFVDALIAATREIVRVTKPTGSIFVNLGDKYSQRVAIRPSSHQDGLFPNRPELRKSWRRDKAAALTRMPYQNVTDADSGVYVPEKSLMGIPWRYALRCIDQLGLILRAEIIWSKPNGLPESVTDRVRRSHEQWFHLVQQPRYFSAVDEIRESYDERTAGRYALGRADNGGPSHTNPLGKLPGSVRTVPTEPLTVPNWLGVDHFAAYPTAWPKWLIQGWAPTRGVCVACGQGRAPTSERTITGDRGGRKFNILTPFHGSERLGTEGHHVITGYTCGCPEPTAPTRPAVILDPFGGTGTTALVANALGCHGITIDMSADYCHLAQWRVNDLGQLAKVLEVDRPPEQTRDQLDLFGGAS